MIRRLPRACERRIAREVTQLLAFPWMEAGGVKATDGLGGADTKRGLEQRVQTLIRRLNVRTKRAACVNRELGASVCSLGPR